MKSPSGKIWPFFLSSFCPLNASTIKQRQLDSWKSLANQLGLCSEVRVTKIYYLKMRVGRGKEGKGRGRVNKRGAGRLKMYVSHIWRMNDPREFTDILCIDLNLDPHMHPHTHILTGLGICENTKQHRVFFNPGCLQEHSSR